MLQRLLSGPRAWRLRSGFSTWSSVSETTSVRRSLGLVTLTRITVFVLGLLSVVIVSRLLTPEEIGVFSVSVAMVGFANLLREFGVGQYLVNVKELTREARRAAFTVTMSISWSIAVALLLLKSFAAAFYSEPDVERVMELLAVNFIVLPFATPLRSVLQREMQFSKMAVVDLSNSAIAAAVTVLAAWQGAGSLSMAWGSIAGNLAALGALVAISPRGAFDWPTTKGLREVFRFGSRYSVATFTTEVGVAAPDLIMGRTLGFADVAYFSRANGVIGMALGQLWRIVGSVYSPVAAKAYREKQDLTALYLRFSEMLLSIVLPAAGMLALLAGPLIDLLFGAQWSRSAPLASLLCIFFMGQAPVLLAPATLVATGNVDLMMRCRVMLEFTRVVLLLSSVLVPLETVVVLLGVAYLAECLIFTVALRASVGIGVRALWRSVRTCYGLTLMTVALPALAMWLLGHQGRQSSMLQIGVAGALGVLCWFGSLLWLRHPMADEVLALLRRLLRGVSGLRQPRS